MSFTKTEIDMMIEAADALEKWSKLNWGHITKSKKFELEANPKSMLGNLTIGDSEKIIKTIIRHLSKRPELIEPVREKYNRLVNGPSEISKLADPSERYARWLGLQGCASELAEELRDIVEIHNSTKPPGDTPVTLREFMSDYCESVSKNILESRVKSLQGLAQKKIITLKHTGQWQSGQSKKYLPEYLISNWETFRKKLISLPKLKQS